MTLTVEVNGRDYVNIESASVSWDFDAAIRRFNIECAAGAIRSPFPIRVNDLIRIFADGVLVCTGYVFGFYSNYNETMHTVDIEGSSLASDLIDSDVEAISLSSPVSLESVIQQTLNQLGLNLPVSSDVNDLEQFTDAEIVNATDGQNAFSFIEQYARKRQVLIGSAADGGVKITRNTRPSPVFLIQNIQQRDDNNVLSGDLQTGTRGRFATYVVKGQQSPVGLNFGDQDQSAEETSDQAGRFTDADVRKGRKKVIQFETANDADLAAERASWQASIDRSQSQQIRYSVFGHSQRGRIWDVGQTVTVKDDFFAIDKVMLIDGVQMVFSLSEGSKTTLRLVDISSYAPEPKEKDFSRDAVFNL